jgi:alpha-L-rhamnosidase
MIADPVEPGYKHIVFKPMPAGDLNFVKYYNETSFGKAGISWQKNDDNFSMDITVPVGSKATVYLPFADGKKILESGNPVEKSDEIMLLENENGTQKLSLGSGNYSFTLN